VRSGSIVVLTRRLHGVARGTKRSNTASRIANVDVFCDADAVMDRIKLLDCLHQLLPRLDADRGHRGDRLHQGHDIHAAVPAGEVAPWLTVPVAVDRGIDALAGRVDVLRRSAATPRCSAQPAGVDRRRHQGAAAPTSSLHTAIAMPR
jgi:hypothetical protein